MSGARREQAEPSVRIPVLTLIFALFCAGAAWAEDASSAAASAPVAQGWGNLFTFKNLIAMLTLSALEIVLGIDNIVVIAIVSGRVDPAYASLCRRVGLAGALLMRLGLLTTINLIMRLDKPFVWPLGFALSGRDLVLVVGGAFLLWKAVKEIKELLEFEVHVGPGVKAHLVPFWWAIAQIMLFDIVFSLDSVITAVALGEHLYVMYAAVVVAVGVMLLFADPIARYIETFPTVKMLALAFLLLIGVILMLDGLHVHISKNYVYVAMGFALLVELLNQWAARVKLRSDATPAQVSKEALEEHDPFLHPPGDQPPKEA